MKKQNTTEMYDSFELMIREEKRAKDNPEYYVNLVADLPDYQPHVTPIMEYENLPQEKIWYPASEKNERWIPQFISIAQSVLTDAQVLNGVPMIDALENSCNDYGLEYILRILHESKCAPEIALEHLILEDLPKKLIDRWTMDDVVSFGKGLARYEKDFIAIRTNFLPHKAMTDIVEFYYTWKRSGRAVKGLVASRARRFYKKRQKSSNLVIESPHAHGVITRSRTLPKDTFFSQAMQVSSISVVQKRISKGVKRKRRTKRDYPIEQ